MLQADGPARTDAEVRDVSLVGTRIIRWVQGREWNGETCQQEPEARSLMILVGYRKGARFWFEHKELTGKFSTGTWCGQNYI